MECHLIFPFFLNIKKKLRGFFFSLRNEIRFKFLDISQESKQAVLCMHQPIIVNWVDALSFSRSCTVLVLYI